MNWISLAVAIQQKKDDTKSRRSTTSELDSFAVAIQQQTDDRGQSVIKEYSQFSEEK